MKFKWKLFISYLLIILIPFVVAERYIASHMTERLIEQTEDQLYKEALLIKALLVKNWNQPASPNQEADQTLDLTSKRIDTLIKELGRDIQARITFIDDQGKVLGDSEIASDQVQHMEDHSRRPEFVEAFQKNHGMAIRYSTTLDIDMMYLAVPIQSQDDFLGIVRVALPLTEIHALISSTESTLVVAFVLCAILILLLNILASRRLSQPIEEITQAAKAISTGNFNIKVRPGGKVKELETLGHSVNTMALEIRNRVREITQEKETLNTILKSMSDGVMVVDTHGRIILINRVLEKLFDHTKDATGKPPVEFIRNAELQDGVSRVLDSGGAFNMELTVTAPESDRVFDVTVTRLMPEGKTEGAVAVFHDISELKRINKVRKDFVANVSHELRTPLTSIKGYAETISQGKLEGMAQAQSFSNIILKHANRLSSLVEDLLSLTRLEAEQNAPAKSDINLKEVLDAAILVVKPGAEKKELTIRTEQVPEKLTAWADRNQISQALINLLDNAVKYTPGNGTITVSGNETENEVHVIVQDTGMGIPREDIDRIFERFYRVDKNRSRDMGGTGLGLSIVKHIIQGHGGRVWVKSHIEQGSTFTFSLPKQP